MSNLKVIFQYPSLIIRFVEEIMTLFNKEMDINRFISIANLCFRCLDICFDNEIERIHALRLIRKMIHIAPDIFPMSLVHVMVAIANEGAIEHDRMQRTCLATLCELSMSDLALSHFVIRLLHTCIHNHNY